MAILDDCVLFSLPARGILLDYEFLLVSIALGRPMRFDNQHQDCQPANTI